MVTKNIKTDYGAVGDGQKVTATVSIGSGSKNLSATTNLWVSGDVGKYIVVPDAATIDGNGSSPTSNPSGNLGGTIVTFTDAQHVVLSDAATRALSGAFKSIEWGTDDSSAFATFNTAFQGQSGVELDVPAGRYVFGGGITLGTSISCGITGLQIIGTGTPVFTDLLGTGKGFFLGGGARGNGQFQNNLHGALTNTVSKGATSVVLQDHTLAGRFTANSWGLQTWLDTQGFGNPSNQFFYEYVFITSVTTVSNVTTITFQSPLVNSYESTGPYFNSGDSTHTDLGGPAMLYSLDPGWDCTHLYSGIGFEMGGGQINSAGRDITYSGGYATGPGIYPSCSKSWTVNDFDASAMAAVEMDKLNELVTINGGTYHGFIFQSPSPNNMIMTNVAVNSIFSSSGKNLTATGCSFPTGVSFGPGSYGSDNSITCTNCTFAGPIALGGVGEPDIFGAAGYSFNSGTITRLMSGGTGEPPQWAIPKQWVWLSSLYAESYAFQVQDVTSDGTTMTITTNLPASLPAIPNNGTYAITTHTAPQLTFSGCTGCEQAVSWSNAPAGKPLGSYWKLTYTSIGTALDPIIISGKMISLKIDVTQAFSGVSPILLVGGQFNNATVIAPNGSAGTFPVSVDLTAVSTRIITPNSVSGSAGSDSLGSAPGAIWIIPLQLQLYTASAVTGGSVTVEIQTDQGISFATFVAPLRLRLHS